MDFIEIALFVLLIVAIALLGRIAKNIWKDLNQLQTLVEAIGCRVAKELGKDGVVRECGVEFGIAPIDE